MLQFWIYIFHYICFIVFFHLSASFIIPKLLGFIYEISLEVPFYFAWLGLELWFIMKRIVLITGTSNNWMEQDLGSVKDEIERSNRTVTGFLLQSMQRVVLQWPHRFANFDCFPATGSFDLSS